MPDEHATENRKGLLQHRQSLLGINELQLGGGARNPVDQRPFDLLRIGRSRPVIPNDLAVPLLWSLYARVPGESLGTDSRLRLRE